MHRLALVLLLVIWASVAEAASISFALPIRPDSSPTIAISWSPPDECYFQDRNADGIRNQDDVCLNASAAGTTFSGLDDTNFSGLVSGHYAYWDGNDWVNGPIDLADTSRHTGLLPLTSVEAIQDINVNITHTPLNYTPTSGTLEGHLEGIDAELLGGGGAVPADPTALIGIDPVVGSANTYMRSDAAPAINPAIVQRRVGGQCLSTQAIRVINEDGTVTCVEVGSPGGGGSNVTINGGAPLATANFNDTTPAPVDGAANVTWQASGADVSAYVSRVGQNGANPEFDKIIDARDYTTGEEFLDAYWAALEPIISTTTCAQLQAQLPYAISVVGETTLTRDDLQDLGDGYIGLGLFKSDPYVGGRPVPDAIGCGIVPRGAFRLNFDLVVNYQDTGANAQKWQAVFMTGSGYFSGYGASTQQGGLWGAQVTGNLSINKGNQNDTGWPATKISGPWTDILGGEFSSPTMTIGWFSSTDYQMHFENFRFNYQVTSGVDPDVDDWGHWAYMSFENSKNFIEVQGANCIYLGPAAQGTIRDAECKGNKNVPFGMVVGSPLNRTEPMTTDGCRTGDCTTRYIAGTGAVISGLATVQNYTASNLAVFNSRRTRLSIWNENSADTPHTLYGQTLGAGICCDPSTGGDATECDVAANFLGTAGADGETCVIDADCDASAQCIQVSDAGSGVSKGRVQGLQLNGVHEPYWGFGPTFWTAETGNDVVDQLEDGAKIMGHTQAWHGNFARQDALPANEKVPDIHPGANAPLDLRWLVTDRNTRWKPDYAGPVAQNQTLLTPLTSGDAFTCDQLQGTVNQLCVDRTGMYFAQSADPTSWETGPTDWFPIGGGNITDLNQIADNLKTKAPSEAGDLLPIFDGEAPLASEPPECLQMKEGGGMDTTGFPCTPWRRDASPAEEVYTAGPNDRLIVGHDGNGDNPQVVADPQTKIMSFASGWQQIFAPPLPDTRQCWEPKSNNGNSQPVCGPLAAGSLTPIHMNDNGLFWADGTNAYGAPPEGGHGLLAPDSVPPNLVRSIDTTSESGEGGGVWFDFSGFGKLFFEGAVADAFQAIVTLGSEPTADETFTIPNGSGSDTFVLADTVQAMSNKFFSDSLGIPVNQASLVTGQITLAQAANQVQVGNAGGDVVLDPLLCDFEITLEDPTDAEDATVGWAGQAVTIQSMRAVLLGSAGQTVTWTLRHGPDRSAAGSEVVTGGTVTTSTTTGSNVTTFDDATIPKDSFVWMETTAQGGTVDELFIAACYTVDGV